MCVKGPDCHGSPRLAQRQLRCGRLAGRLTAEGSSPKVSVRSTADRHRLQRILLAGSRRDASDSADPMGGKRRDRVGRAQCQTLFRHRRKPPAWLMVPYAVGAESSLEQIDNAAMRVLTSLHLKQIVRESEQPEASVAQPAQCRLEPGMGR